MIVEWKNSSKQTKTGQLTIKTIHVKGVKILNYNHQIDLQERIKNATKIF